MGLTSKKGTSAASEETQNNSRLIAFKQKLQAQTERRLERNNRLVLGIWGEPKTVK